MLFDRHLAMRIRNLRFIYMRHTIHSARSAVVALVAITSALFADTVEIKNGARVIGKIGRIDAGTVEIDTTFAGTIKIKQSEVTSITTDAPVAVRLASGTRFDG